MDPVLLALKALRKAEAEILTLIQGAIAEGAYANVAQLAVLAESLANTIARVGSPEVAVTGRPTAVVDPTEYVLERLHPDPAISRPRISKNEKHKTTYPRFETERDRLVKIGWSKKDRDVYEHRATRATAIVVSLYLSDVANTTVFRMEDILPIKEDDGTEIPLYQSYLVLAWLRNIGLVQKQGKDGYQWTVDSFDESAFDRAWAMTQART